MLSVVVELPRGAVPVVPRVVAEEYNVEGGVKLLLLLIGSVMTRLVAEGGPFSIIEGTGGVDMAARGWKER